MDAFTIAGKITLDTSDFESKLASAEGSAKGLEKGAVMLGNLASTAVTKGLHGLAEFGRSVVDTGTKFTAMMSKVQSVSGATETQMAQLTDLAQQMGATTKFTATEAAEALSYMGMAGWDADQMMAGLPGILSLAAASGSDLGRTSDIVTDALTAFGLSAGDAGHFADVLAVASANANTNVDLMGETFKYVAAASGSLHISAEDTAEAIGLIANAGIKGSQAGTSLRSIITRIATDAGASEKTLGALGIITDELGVQVYDAAGQFRDFGDILSETRTAWQSLTDDQQKTNFAKQIAGQYGLSAWLSLMNASTESVDELRAAIESSDGAAGMMASTMLDNLQGDLTLLNSAIDGLKLVASQEFDSQLRGFVQSLTEGVGQISNVLKYGFFGDGGIIDLENGMTSASERADQALKNAAADEIKAKSLYEQLLAMSESAQSSEGAMQAWQQAANELIGLCPQLASSIDMANAAFTASSESVYADIEAMTQRAKVMALQQAITDKTTALTNAQQEEISRRAETMIKQAEFDAALAPALERANQLIDKYGISFQSYNFETGQFDTKTHADTREDVGQALAQLSRTRGVDMEDLQGLSELESTASEAEAALDAAASAQENMSAAVASAQAEYSAYVGAVQSMISEITGLSSSISSLPDSKDIDININYHTNGSSDLTGDLAPHAKGAWDIPYDNYPALLHRGERVLTATQARMDRMTDGGNVDPRALASALRSAVMDLTLSMDHETVGRVMGDATSRRVSGNIAQMSRRAQYGYGG